MYGIYANIGSILMGSMLPYIAYMDPIGYINGSRFPVEQLEIDINGGFRLPEGSSYPLVICYLAIENGH